ncbi:MAG: hypothetical protein ACM3ZE_26460 [Myxococcales bacterium]
MSVALAVLLVACQSSVPTKSGGSGTSTDIGTGARPTGTGGSGSTNGTGLSPASGATARGGNGSTTTSNVISQSLTLTQASARIAGRLGNQLIVAVEGQAALGTLGALELTLEGASGKPIAFFDSNWDGIPDSSTGRVAPTAPPVGEKLNLEVALDGLERVEVPTQLSVALVDRRDGKTAPLLVAIQQQTVAELGETCDPSLVISRCRQGLSCSAKSRVCVGGTAPVISHAYFRRGAEGPTIRADGIDPDEDVILIRVDFLSSAGKPVMLDLDGDDSPDANYLELDTGLVNRNAGFVVSIQSGLGFDVLSPQLGLTAIDAMGNVSPTQRVAISNGNTGSAGQVCDLDNLVGCAEGSVCIPGVLGTVTFCTDLAQAAATRCNVAATWNLSKDGPKFTGTTAGYSYFAPPLGCVPDGAEDGPEALIQLHIDTATPHLVLTTAVPETTIDTALSVLSRCGGDFSTALACSDDSLGYTSSVTLSNLAAGDY